MSREFSVGDGCWHTRRDQIRYLLTNTMSSPELAALLTEER